MGKVHHERAAHLEQFVPRSTKLLEPSQLVLAVSRKGLLERWEVRAIPHHEIWLIPVRCDAFDGKEFVVVLLDPVVVPRATVSDFVALDIKLRHGRLGNSRGALCH